MSEPVTTTYAVGNGRPSTPPSSKRIMLTFGPLTEARARAILEEQLAAVWAAALESHGYDWREGWAIRFEDFRLEMVGPPPQPSAAQAEAGVAPPSHPPLAPPGT